MQHSESVAVGGQPVRRSGSSATDKMEGAFVLIIGLVLAGIIHLTPVKWLRFAGGALIIMLVIGELLPLFR